MIGDIERHDEPHSGWQPIETAPKDGTHFLAHCVWSDGSKDDAGRHVVAWIAGCWRTTLAHIPLETDADISDSMSPIVWMPLPSPPETKE